MSSPFELRSLFHAHYGYVLRTLVRLGVHAADAEDAAQELFLLVHARRADYDPARPVRPWLFGFAVRVAANQRRRTQRRAHVQVDEQNVQAREQDPEAQLDHAQRGALLRRALDVLDLAKRAVLVAHDLDGMSGPDVAELLAIPVNTVYSRLHEARRLVHGEARRLEEAER